MTEPPPQALIAAMLGAIQLLLMEAARREADEPAAFRALLGMMAQLNALSKQWLEPDAQRAYHDPTCPPRECDRCGKVYTGPALYCRLACAVADA